MERLRREVDRLFADWPARTGWTVARSYPAMNVWTDENTAVVTAELPGVAAEDIDISVENDTLTVRGARKREDLGDGVTFHRRERRFGSFKRSFRLPFQVDAAKVLAEFKDGVLSIMLPRAEADKPRKISITAG
jgi:HSP20 family protein